VAKLPSGSRPRPGRIPPPSTDCLSDADLVSAIAAGPGATPDAGPALDQAGGLTALMGLTEQQVAVALRLRAQEARRIALAQALHLRLLRYQSTPRPHLGTPEMVAAVMRPLVQLDHERLWVLPLDARCHLIGQPIEVTRGDVDGTGASPRSVCRAALRAGASSMIVVHNHPTADPTPSKHDISATSSLVAAGRTIDVDLADHLIVCADGRWASLRRDHRDLFS
jgi:DNA repair protein RadC